MSTLEPRVVLVTRQTEFERLIASHATRAQAEFFLRNRGQSLEDLELQHERHRAAIKTATRAIPPNWSKTSVIREDLDRFLFSRDDIVIAIGQDGLVANLAKYLDGQPVVGVSPDTSRTESILTPMSADVLSTLLPRIAANDLDYEKRAMVEAQLSDGQRLAALNELFIGHKSHQSARYVISAADAEELHSSSGVIVSTGTGLSGWARSILTATQQQISIRPEERRAAYFAREPWPSRNTGCDITIGEIGDGECVKLTSRMNDGGVIFADGIEQDFLRFSWGTEAEVGLSSRTLNLVAAR